jgi:excisionase family DNA binding protein
MDKLSNATAAAGGAGYNRPSPNPTDPQREPLAVTVPVALEISGLGRTTLYSLIARGEIKSVRVGARRLIDFASLKAFLTSQEA